MDEQTLDTLHQQSRQPVPNSRDTVDSGQPASVQGDVRRADSGASQQADQQQMNYQAQQQANVPQQQRQYHGPTITVGGKDVPYYPAPIGHVSSSVTRLAVRAREQERTAANVDVPASATPEALASAKYVPMPAGGIQGLVHMLFPDDIDNQDAFDGHVFDIMHLNRDTLRDDTSSSVGQMVRVPG